MNLAWWALAVLELLAAIWVTALAIGYVRLRILLRELRRDMASGDSDHTSNH